jgi:hypothetical protein
MVSRHFSRHSPLQSNLLILKRHRQAQIDHRLLRVKARHFRHEFKNQRHCLRQSRSTASTWFRRIISVSLQQYRDYTTRPDSRTTQTSSSMQSYRQCHQYLGWEEYVQSQFQILRWVQFQGPTSFLSSILKSMSSILSSILM